MTLYDGLTLCESMPPLEETAIMAIILSVFMTQDTIGNIAEIRYSSVHMFCFVTKGGNEKANLCEE